jgi:hypothetical protein
MEGAMKKILGLLMVCACLLDGPVYAAYEATGKAEDTAEADAMILVPAGTVRRDTAASSAGTTGDHATLNTDSTGRVWANTELPDAAALADATANPTVTGLAAYMMCFNGTTWDRCIASSNIAHDAAAASANPLLTGCYASAAAPTDVTADTDATREWCLRNGARAIQPTFAGILATTGNGVSGTGVQRVTIASDSTGVVGLATGSNTIGALTANQSVNVAQINGVTTLMGAGNTGTGSQRVTEATDSQLSAGVGATGDAAATAGSTGSVNAKLRLMSSQLDTMSTAIASLLTSSQLVDDDQTGASINYRTSVGTTEDETEIKATAGRLLSIQITNTNAAARYFRCANLTAANTTPGTSTVFYGIAVPGATTGGGVVANFGPAGIAFSTALTCWVVTGAADTDVAEVAANEIKWNIIYK